MRYLVHRGTGTIIDPLDHVVIVDTNDDNLEEEDILELARQGANAIILTSSECLWALRDKDIVDELHENVYNGHNSNAGDIADYLYCLTHLDTIEWIRDEIIHDGRVLDIYGTVWHDAILTVATAHRQGDGVAE
jgi:hypothetical protein